MKSEFPTRQQSTDEVADLRARLAEASETLRAIRSGDVDAVLVHGPQGDQLFTLKGADEPYRVLIEEMNQGAVTLSAAGSILYCNRRFADLLKTPLDQIVGRAFASFVALSDQRKFSKLLEAGRKKSVAGEITLIALDASAVPFQLAFSRLPQHSDAEMCLVATDISESRDKEMRLRKTMAELVKAQAAADKARSEAPRANQAKSRFLSRTSHELRTPMNAILGFGQLLEEEEDLGLASRESVAQILRAGRHLLQIIDEVLDISCVESGDIGLTIEPVHVGEVLEEMAQFVEQLAAAYVVELEIVPSEQRDWGVLADRKRLKQVLLTFLSNAIKYSPPDVAGKVRMGCMLSPAAGAKTLRITVQDNGSGISAEKLTRLFTPFDRLDAERTHAHIPGTGLGLALSKTIVELSGGTLGVESTPGQGSIFWLDLPLVEAALRGDPYSAPPSVSDTPLSFAATKTLLYVEDNMDNLQLMESIMAGRPGIQLLGAAEGMRGVALACEHRPDLVLLDLNLPDIGGEEVLDRLRADPRTSAIPVVVLSGDSSPGKIENMLERGAHEYVTKPFQLTQFLAVVDEALHASPREKDIEG